MPSVGDLGVGSMIVYMVSYGVENISRISGVRFSGRD